MRAIVSNILRRLRRSERGSVTVEFAVTLAFLVFPLFIGTIDLSRLMHADNILTRTAREAVVVASRGGDAAGIARTIVQSAGLSPSLLTVSVTSAPDASVSGTSVRVELGYDLNGFALFAADVFMPDGLKAVAEARKE
ncbi:TadE family protein [Desulfovibrio sp. X2]|uniref:TadE/TadG family type IV pilus assembly protein n=1 Tax=Desulfovibrio sp. X2 TaxID=941449 RepID=UPI000358868D|nr:TadE family protein [Desulfovibrio sp. X2]EPR44398.1 TadE family protein [Desulfovibrio sp. X2]